MRKTVFASSTFILIELIGWASNIGEVLGEEKITSKPAITRMNTAWIRARNRVGIITRYWTRNNTWITTRIGTVITPQFGTRTTTWITDWIRTYYYNTPLTFALANKLGSALGIALGTEPGTALGSELS
jgi:hypothetical protein